MSATQSSTAPIALDDLRTIEGLAAEHPNLLSVTTLRYQLRDRDTNGLASATVPVGKKLLISKSLYEKWLGSRAGKA